MRKYPFNTKGGSNNGRTGEQKRRNTFKNSRHKSYLISNYNKFKEAKSFNPKEDIGRMN